MCAVVLAVADFDRLFIQRICAKAAVLSAPSRVSTGLIDHIVSRSVCSLCLLSSRPNRRPSRTHDDRGQSTAVASAETQPRHRRRNDRQRETAKQTHITGGILSDRPPLDSLAAQMSYSSDSSSSPPARPRASPDPQRTLARELLEQELRRGGVAGAGQQQWTPATEFEQTQYRPASSPQQQQQAAAQSAAFADYRAEYARQPAAGGSYPQHPELRALSETMRSVHVPSNLEHQPYSNPSQYGAQGLGQALQHGGAQFCQICEADEGGMNPAQRRQHEQHLQERMYYQSLQQQQQQQAAVPTYTAGWGVYASEPQPVLSSYAPSQQPAAAAGASLASSFRTTVASPPRGLSGLGNPPPVLADDSVLYTSQPSRAVLSALRTLQDKLQE